MGAKSAKNSRQSADVLSPNERRRVIAFLDSSGSRTQFNSDDMKKLWKDLLVPDLLQTYTDVLMKQDIAKKNYIGIDQFVYIYSALVRGDAEEKASALAAVVGATKNGAGQEVLSFINLCKYLSDLLESYFLGLRHRNDKKYKSWTQTRHPERSAIEDITLGLCADLPCQNDEVQVHEMEQWLNHTAVISVLHSYVVGSLYNLEPDVESSLIPFAVLPSSKTPTHLNLPQVVYLNSFIPLENKAKWRFLFSTATHGESFSKFVGSITNEGPVLIVIEGDDGSVFGGFVSENLSPGPRWVGSGDCFLFKLKPTVEVFPSTGYNDHYVYLNMSLASLPKGLGMGGQFDYWGLWIDSQFGNGECSDSCTTYRNYKTLAKQKKFHIRRLEIWGVGDPPPTAEERGERTYGQTTASVLDKDRAATHILEMVGRKTHSEGLRDDPPAE